MSDKRGVSATYICVRTSEVAPRLEENLLKSSQSLIGSV